MELSTVVGIIVIVVVALVLMKFLGKFVSFLFSMLGIVAVVWLVVIGLRWMDETNMRDNFLESNNLFLLEDEGDIVTGFATQGGYEVTEKIEFDELDNPNSRIYDDYYKVVVVNKDALPQKTSLLVDVSEDPEKESLFKSYVDNNILEGDFVTNLISEEQEGNLQVYKETLAFKQGVKEVLKS